MSLQASDSVSEQPHCPGSTQAPHGMGNLRSETRFRGKLVDGSDPVAYFLIGRWILVGE